MPKPPDPPAPAAYSYLRFSNPAQAAGDSVRRQTALRDAWVAKAGVRLDTTVGMTDAGVSAFKGVHRENPDRNALAAFLDLVKRGRIERGSYLIVENLDRLSREHIRPALTLLLNLIESGIRVVQLLPTEQVFDEKVEPMVLMMAIMELSRGHSESRMKSERSGAAWAARKRRARDGVIATRTVPSWVRVEGGKFVLIEPAAAAVRRVFKMAADGYGVTAIVKKLNTEGVPAISRGGVWQRAFVMQLLTKRTARGEYQPYTGSVRDRNSRKPDGPPIPDYYPAAVTEAEWTAARSAVVGRRGRQGGRESGVPNLFVKLLRDARDGNLMHRANKGARGSGLVYVNAKAESGVTGAEYLTFPADPFDAAVLGRLREIDPRDILPTADGPGEAAGLVGRLAGIDARMERVKAKLVTGGDDVDPLVEVVRGLAAERKAVEAKLAEARRKESSPLATAWGECRTLLDALADAPDPADARVRLRAAIRRVVSGIWCLFVPADGRRKGRWRFAAVQVWFHGGGRRDYLILHRGGAGNQAKRNARGWWVRSLSEAGVKGHLDLRDAADAARLAKVLEKADPRAFAAEK